MPPKRSREDDDVNDVPIGEGCITGLFTGRGTIVYTSAVHFALWQERITQ